MGIKLNTVKKLSIIEIGTSRCSHFGNFLMFPKENSRSFHWKHKKIKNSNLRPKHLRCKLLLASNWPPKSGENSKNRFFPQWQAQRTFFVIPRAKYADGARLCGFFHRPPTAPVFRYRPLSSKTRQFLKIRWANHPCGFDPRHRHQQKAAERLLFAMKPPSARANEGMKTFHS